MLPLLAPLLGSLLGPSLFGAMGLSSPWLAGALGSGLASLAVTRDPQQALMSGLTGGLTAGLGGGLGGLLGGGADTATKLATSTATDALTKGAGAAMNPAIAAAQALKTVPIDLAHGGLGALSGATPLSAASAATKAATKAAPTSPLGGIGNFVRDHPLAMVGGLGALSLLPNPPEYTEGEQEDIPENYPTGPGPRSGYGAGSAPADTPARQASDMTVDDYKNYGKTTAVDPREAQFFTGGEGVPVDDGPTPYNEDMWSDGIPGSAQAALDAMRTDGIPGNYADARRERMRRALRSWRFADGGYLEYDGTARMAGGGHVRGPGGPREDLVQAVGPGQQPIRLSAGEYVMPAKAVNNAGGPDAMDQLRARLLRV